MAKNSSFGTLSRRKFVRHAAVAASLFPILNNIDFVSDSFAQAAPTDPVDENSPTAKALGYVADASKADFARFPQAKDAVAKGAHCAKCMLMTQGGLKCKGKDGDWGKCSLFPMGLVNLNGWCMSFTPKPA